MALLWIEGFEGFGTTVGSAPSPSGVYGRKYTVVSENGFQVVTGRWAGYALKFVLDTCAFKAPDLTTNATLFVGLAYKTLNGLNHEFLTFYDGATRGVNLRWVSGGNLAVYRADTQLGVTTGLGLQTNTWYYVEFKVVCNATTGSYEVRVDTVNVLSATSVNTKAGSNNYHTTFRIQDVWGENPTFDDLYCLDGSGSAPANTFLGVKHVVTIFPNGAGDAAQWTPSAGNNWDCVEEPVMDDNGTYVATAGSGNLDLYAYEDIPATAMENDVIGVQINSETRRTQATTFNLLQPCKLSGVQSDGSAVAVDNDGFLTKTRVMEKDPSNNAWTLDNIGLAQFGVLLG